MYSEAETFSWAPSAGYDTHTEKRPMLTERMKQFNRLCHNFTAVRRASSHDGHKKNLIKTAIEGTLIKNNNQIKHIITTTSIHPYRRYQCQSIDIHKVAENNYAHIQAAVPEWNSLTESVMKSCQINKTIWLDWPVVLLSPAAGPVPWQ